MKKEIKQHRVFVVGFLLIMAVILWFFLKPYIFQYDKKRKEKEEQKISQEILRVPSISSVELQKKISNQEEIVIVDLRNGEDFQKGHIPQSVNISLQELDLKKLNSLSANKKSLIVLVDEGEEVYSIAKKTNEIVDAGYENAKYLQGGIFDWQSQGLSVISGGKSPFDERKVKKVKVEEIAPDLIQGKEIYQFVDLRLPEEFEKGHIHGAVNIPFSEIEKDQKKISMAKKVVLYGGSEEEAQKAAVVLFDFNYFNIYVLEGGLEAWKNAGGKLE